MTKDEMKDKISMALKDPILQQGFEIICKNLAELEKENAELKEKISILLSCKNCPENKGGWICTKEYENKCLAQKIEFIKELKKENAEMKEQLIKAKEIIKDYMTIAKGNHTTVCGVPEENRTIYVLKLNEEAEQFIKE